MKYLCILKKLITLKVVFYVSLMFQEEISIFNFWWSETWHIEIQMYVKLAEG